MCRRNLYRPQLANEVCEGYVFTPVNHPVYGGSSSGGGVGRLHPGGLHPGVCIQKVGLGRPPPQHRILCAGGTHPTGMHSYCTDFQHVLEGEKGYTQSRSLIRTFAFHLHTLYLQRKNLRMWFSTSHLIWNDGKKELLMIPFRKRLGKINLIMLLHFWIQVY